MPLTLNTCPHCGSATHTIALDVLSPQNDTYAQLIDASFSPPVRYLECLDCGLTFRNQIFTADEANALYQSAYRQHILRDMTADAYFDKVIGIPADDSELDAKISNLKNLVKGIQIAKAMDIGCGVGAFIYKLSATLDNTVVEGIEPTTEFSAVAAKRNHTRVFNKAYDGFSLHEYDLVTCIHVLEHTLSPWEFLRAIADNMKSGSHLYLETPSTKDIKALPADHDRFMSPHNYLFSSEFMALLLERSGFRAISLTYAPTQRGKVDLRVFAVKN